MKTILAILLCGLIVAIGGCASQPRPEPIVQPVPVSIPVSVPCPAIVAAAQAYPDSEGALRSADGIYNRVRLLMAGRLLRIIREEELTTALEVCGVVIPPG